MTRRTFLPVAAGFTQAGRIAPAMAQTVQRKGRLKQSVARWCFSKIQLRDLAKECARLGLKGIDLVGHDEWPVLQEFGLVPSMTPGGGTIPVGFNRKENHDKLVDELHANIEKAAAAGVPNVITFSGNRRGLSDQEGIETCAIGLDRVKKFAEEKGVTVCMELLNSKVNHKDYQCDHTAFGVEVCKRVNSPRMKLLYDIYHMQIMEGDIIRTIRDNFQYLGHFHTGGVPDRHELDGKQELNWRAIAEAIAALNFTGYFAHEFIPSRDPLRSLAEAVELCDV
jgi:hydroxypyruvate isomerase